MAMENDLNRTEPAIGQPPEPAPGEIGDAVACDYVDVVRSEGVQPCFTFRPHRDGGAIANRAFVLEIEGARALWRHLGQLIEDGAKAAP